MHVAGVPHVMELAAAPPATEREALLRRSASCVLGPASANDAAARPLALMSLRSIGDWPRSVVQRLRGKPPFEGL
jgi:hypothetical protein